VFHLRITGNPGEPGGKNGLVSAATKSRLLLSESKHAAALRSNASRAGVYGCARPLDYGELAGFFYEAHIEKFNRRGCD
jgi:hypothetical protein